MSNGIMAFAPNRLGHSMSNRGIERLTKNWGHGVGLLGPKPPVDEKEKSPMNSLRVSTARQVGKKKTELGF
jgi:hypothetical protein